MGTFSGMAEAARELLRDAFTRLIEHADEVTDGLSDEVSSWQPVEGANSIAWLVWHSARGQDLQVSDIAGTEQVWTRDGWRERFALDLQVDRRHLAIAFDEREAERLTRSKALKPGLFDRADVDEHILAAIVTRDEAETL